MIRWLLIALGSLCVALGVIGAFVPGLPTTVFLLAAAALYVRSSPRLYRWLLNHRLLGRFIRDYREHRAMPRRAKNSALVLMWLMIGLSAGFLIGPLWIRLTVVAAGLVGTFFMARIPVYDSREEPPGSDD